MDVFRLVCAVSLTATILSAGCNPESAVAAPANLARESLAASLSVAPAVEQTPSAPKAATGPATQIQNPVPPGQAQASPAPLSSREKNRQLRNQQLIDAVEQAYRTGVDNYHAGHLEAARDNFDYAVDQMLTSGLDLKNDLQLSAEFEHIVDAVNTLEMEALKQGNGFEPPTEPTPVSVANDVTFAVNPELKAEAQTELKTTQSDLPLVLNDYVASYINFFANTRAGHATIVNSLTRAGRYKTMIQRILAEEGVPQDLIYQAVAESGFQVRIMNGRGSGAGGMWQFMPGDAHAPPRSAWFDQRFDPEASTRAYARYIKFLYQQLGDWYLAMAAYDWGAGNVQRAVQRTGYADFWELYRRNALPQETKNYVPIILAAAIMAKNPKQYGLDSIVFDPPLLADSVTTNYSVDLRLVADLVEAPVQEIAALNPSLLRMATPPDDSFTLHLPPGTKELFSRRIDEVPVDRRRSWRFHKVSAGDTIEAVAREYHVSPTELAFVNQVDAGSDLSGTEGLVVPVAAAPSSSAGSTRYTTRRGDTLVTLADRFNVSVEQLRSWNHLKGAAIAPGRTLNVSEPARVSSAHGRHRGAASAHSSGRKAASKSPSKTAAGSAAKTQTAAATQPRKHLSSTP